MNGADLLVFGLVGLSALAGARRGLTGQLFSLAGLAGGAILGSRVAPSLLESGARSPWVPVTSLVGALVGAVVLQIAAGSAAGIVRGFVVRGPLRLADSAGGVLTGAALGLGVAWLAAVVALHQPGVGLRRTVQDSAILPALVGALPPEDVLHALRRFDPLPLIAGLPDGLPPPDRSVLSSRGARRAARSVVKIEGTSCGLGVQGSGWVIRKGLVATNAHVIAGQEDTRVLAPNGKALEAAAVYVDARNDVALLQVPSLAVSPLEPARRTSSGERVVILGYPEDGPLTAVPGTVASATKLLAPNAYGKRVGVRTVVPFRGSVRPGSSGGPVLNGRGRVVAMTFAATRRTRGGLGVPVAVVLKGLPSRSEGPVSTGPCAG